MKAWISVIVLTLGVGTAVGGCGRKAPEGTVEGDCVDGSDNDRNGVVDCDDQGCYLDSACLAAAAEARDRSQPTRPAETAKTPAPFAQVGDLWVTTATNGSDVDFAQAEQYCAALQVGDHTDWRLPTKEEAVRVAQAHVVSESAVMWTTDKKGTNRRFVVGITSGAIHDLALDSKGQCRALCVRDATDSK